jgi:hypothetical protein
MKPPCPENPFTLEKAVSRDERNERDVKPEGYQK